MRSVTSSARLINWVLTVPWPRRWLLAREPKLLKGVLRVALRRIARWYRQRSGLDGRTGGVTVVQRFGSALGLNIHFHVLMLDGVYQDRDATLPFVTVPPPSTDEVAVLVEDIATRVERWLCKAGYGGEERDAHEEEEDLQSLIQSASVQGRIGLGKYRGQKSRRVQWLSGKAFTLPPQCATFEGYNLHAGVEIAAWHRPGLEQLCRYVLRPPLAKTRLSETSDGGVEMQLKRAWSDGTTSLRFTALELVEKLAALVPPPRKNQVFYHGVLGARSKWRSRIVPGTSPAEVGAPSRRITKKPASTTSRHVPWEQLLRRTFGVFGWMCAKCGGFLELRAVVLGGPESRKILESMARSARGPPDSP